MILTPTELLAMGLNISTEIPQTKVAAAIEEAELSILKPAIGDTNYIALLGMQSNDPAIAGGQYTKADGTVVFLAGVKKAAAYLAFACLLRHNISATVFGSVQKTDEHSQNADPWEWCRYNFQVGASYLREVAAALGWKANLGDTYFAWNC